MANNQQAAGRKKESAAEYFKGVKKEMGKVVWPTRRELASYTVVVVAICTVFAVGFWLVDIGVLTALKNILGITLS